MGTKSLSSKLLVAVSCLVIGSGLLISVLVTQRYTESLLSAITAQADSLGHAIALEAAEGWLLNDRVALQKMLDHQMRTTLLPYLFVSLEDGKILAHTFGKYGSLRADRREQGVLRRSGTLATDRFNQARTLPGYCMADIFRPPPESSGSDFQRNPLENKSRPFGFK